MNHVLCVRVRIVGLLLGFADLSRVLGVKDGLLGNLGAVKVEVEAVGGGFGDVGEGDLVVNGRFG